MWLAHKRNNNSTYTTHFTTFEAIDYRCCTIKVISVVVQCESDIIQIQFEICCVYSIFVNETLME